MSAGHTERIPADILDILLAKGRRKAKARAMIRRCLVDGEDYYIVAKENGVSRQYIWEACSLTLRAYRGYLSI